MNTMHTNCLTMIHISGTYVILPFAVPKVKNVLGLITAWRDLQPTTR